MLIHCIYTRLANDESHRNFVSLNFYNDDMKKSRINAFNKVEGVCRVDQKPKLDAMQAMYCQLVTWQNATVTQMSSLGSINIDIIQ